MKICPQCGATGRDEDVACAVDGAALVPLSTATTLPAGLRAGPSFPGQGGPQIGEFRLVGAHGEGDAFVVDAGGRARLLLFGQKQTMADEASALRVTSAVFPFVVAEGFAKEVGAFVALTTDVARATPLAELRTTLVGGLALIRALLDAASELESRGFTWEPSLTDLYVRPDGRLMALRARGARRKRDGETVNAKRVLEALGETLLPFPMAAATPEIVRLLLPRWNFSTLAHRSLASVDEVLARAEETRRTKSLGRVAAMCDPGLRRNHNEDAVATAEGEVLGEPFTVLVVCDGVSSSTHAERASAIAVSVTRDALVRAAHAGDVARDAAAAMQSAIQEAHAAICAADIDCGDGAPPGTTLVAAIVRGRVLTVGWVGDSRAYWVSAGASELCTVDHSWLNDVVATGALTVAEAMHSPLAHALTKCLGPLDREGGGAAEIEPDVSTRTLVAPGHVVLCTDGLWNYFPSAAAIEQLVKDAGPEADPDAVARFLVCSALAEGGGDNVSVAVHALAAPRRTE